MRARVHRMEKSFSPSRLLDHVACNHRTALWLQGTAGRPADPSATIMRQRGLDHEAVVLQRLEALHGPATRIDVRSSPRERACATRSAVSAAAPLIYQATLLAGRWTGMPDFLVLSEDGSSYRPEDAKLGLRMKREYRTQLSVYRTIMRAEAYPVVAEGTIYTGSGRAETVDLSDIDVETRTSMDGLEGFVDAGGSSRGPIRRTACKTCEFSDVCRAEWKRADSISLVGGIRSKQVETLIEAGVATVSDLAAVDPSSGLAGISPEPLARIVAQASLQLESSRSGAAVVEILPHVTGRGFDLLPPPSPFDLFFDMEGYPHDTGGLEYLFGIWGRIESDTETFTELWGHDREQERLVFEKFIDLATIQHAQHPDARIFHYNGYETRALKRLAAMHGTRIAETDALIAAGVFVDLLPIARQTVRTSAGGHSLKQLETVYWGGRSGTVTDAGSSIVEYERWRTTGDRSIIEAIGLYNKDDCVSTKGLRDWLVRLRDQAGIPQFLTRRRRNSAARAA
jgi:predicted RecB family nuclease